MEDFGRENGYELSRCEFVKEGKNWYLRVFVDRIIDGVYDYMTDEDTKIVLKYISAKLDEADPIPQQYYFEVSSPGLDRPLLSEKDYIRFSGEAVDVKLYEATDGIKEFTAILDSYADGAFTFSFEDSEPLVIQKEKVAKINLAVIF